MSYTDAVLKYVIEYASRPLPPTPKNMSYIDVIDFIDKFKHPSLPIISRFRFFPPSASQKLCSELCSELKCEASSADKKYMYIMFELGTGVLRVQL